VLVPPHLLCQVVDASPRGRCRRGGDGRGSGGGGVGSVDLRAQGVRLLARVLQVVVEGVALRTGDGCGKVR